MTARACTALLALFGALVGLSSCGGGDDGDLLPILTPFPYTPPAVRAGEGAGGPLGTIESVSYTYLTGPTDLTVELTAVGYDFAEVDAGEGSDEVVRSCPGEYQADEWQTLVDTLEAVPEIERNYSELSGDVLHELEVTLTDGTVRRSILTPNDNLPDDLFAALGLLQGVLDDAFRACPGPADGEPLTP